MIKILSMLFFAMQVSAATKAHEPIWFDMTGLSHPTRITSLRDLSNAVSLSENGHLDQYGMATLVKKLKPIIDQNEVSLQWHEEGCLNISILPSQARVLVLMPRMYAHSISEKARFQIMHLSEKLRNKPIYKLLRAFDTVDIR